MKLLAFSVVILLCSVLPAAAQGRSEMLIRGSDTLVYTYVPLEAESAAEVADTVSGRRGFLHRFVDYFEKANVDRTFEKKMDFSFIGGPSYSSTTKLGLGVMAAGLFRTDRTDSLTPPSDVALFCAGSITGFYSVGIKGNTIFKHDRNRLIYKLNFYSQPSDFWGMGYWAGAHNPKSTYSEKKSSIDIRYLHRMARNFYVGALLGFEYVKGIKFTCEEYLDGMRTRYAETGMGLLAEYDSRDFAPNPWRGVCLSLNAVLYPKGLGSCPTTLWRVSFTASTYRKLWTGGLLAMELYGEFNSSETPWPFMARMGGDSRMRGYYEGRYTDLDMMVVQAELRQHIWRRFSGVVWGAAGNVFSRFSRFDWSETLPNYGVGIRWEFKKRVNVRFDYGFGRDTNGLVMQINEAF